jgi:hypothetical protein
MGPVFIGALLLFGCARDTFFYWVPDCRIIVEVRHSALYPTGPKVSWSVAVVNRDTMEEGSAESAELEEHTDRINVYRTGPDAVVLTDKGGAHELNMAALHVSPAPEVPKGAVYVGCFGEFHGWFMFMSLEQCPQRPLHRTTAGREEPVNN